MTVFNVASPTLHATFHATNNPRSQVHCIHHHRGERRASARVPARPTVQVAHLRCMSNHTIAPQITTWAEARYADREVLNRAEVASLLALDPRTIDHAIADGTIPAVHVGRRILIPRRPFLAAFGALFETSGPDEAVQ